MFEAFLTTDSFINKDGHCEWASEENNEKVETHKLGKFKTFDKALDAIYNSDRLQDSYPACFIYTKKDGEVYSSVPTLTKCECCGHEEWDRMTSKI